jgi:hypothetical protein
MGGSATALVEIALAAHGGIVGRGNRIKAPGVRRLEGTGEDIGGGKQAVAPARSLPVGLRLIVIVAAGLIGWAVPLGLLYLLW